MAPVTFTRLAKRVRMEKCTFQHLEQNQQRTPRGRTPRGRSPTNRRKDTSPKPGARGNSPAARTRNNKATVAHLMTEDQVLSSDVIDPLYGFIAFACPAMVRPGPPILKHWLSSKQRKKGNVKVSWKENKEVRTIYIDDGISLEPSKMYN